MEHTLTQKENGLNSKLFIMSKIRILFIFALCIVICSCGRINGYGKIRVINNSDYHVAVISPSFEREGNGADVLDEDVVGTRPLSCREAVSCSVLHNLGPASGIYAGKEPVEHNLPFC